VLEKDDMNIKNYEEIFEQGYDLNMLFVISLSREEIESFSSSKVKAWVQTCIRKGLLNEDLTITLSGRQLLDLSNRKFTNDEIQTAVKSVIDLSEDFEKWWEIFPSTDYFEWKGKTFEGGRALKINKTTGKPNNCKSNFYNIVNEGKYSPEDIIRATEFHVETIKDLSVKKNENKLSFLANSERYLRQRMFGPYVELSKGKKPKQEKSNETFI